MSSILSGGSFGLHSSHRYGYSSAEYILAEAMQSKMATDHADSSHYTSEDWQAQLEEVLALQSIFADDFRCAVAYRTTIMSRN